MKTESLERQSLQEHRVVNKDRVLRKITVMREDRILRKT